jgi:hypothetical protein
VSTATKNGRVSTTSNAALVKRVEDVEASVRELQAVLKAIVTKLVVQSAAPAAMQNLENEISARIDKEGLGAIIAAG